VAAFVIWMKGRASQCDIRHFIKMKRRLKLMLVGGDGGGATVRRSRLGCWVDRMCRETWLMSKTENPQPKIVINCRLFKADSLSQ